MNNNQTTTNKPTDRPNDRYPEFSASVINHFNAMLEKGSKKLFTTNATGLFEAYLNNMPLDGRQHYNCHACRHFIERYGNLVIINDNGSMESAIWNEETTPEFFLPSVKVMKKIVENAKVTGVLVPIHKNLGTPVTGIWTHLSVSVPRDMVHNSRTEFASQVEAKKKEDYKTVVNGLLEYPINIVEQAVNILKAETLYRGERYLGVAEWLYNLHKKRDSATSSKAKDNITWLAIATAPEGFCHVKSSMIGTLLDDIKSGLPFESVKNRFAEKMAPGTFMRAQAAPTENAIQQAEKRVKDLGIENSLRRRYPTFDEVPSFIWKGNNVEKKEVKPVGGVFGNIIPKDKQPTTNQPVVPSAVMTWEKFQRTVLPTAQSIEVKVDNPNRFMSLVTAVDETAPNILLWDNFFSWYYHGGVDAEIRKRVEAAGGKYENNEIRCSLIWDGRTDLDLHCITPFGQEIYYPHGARRGRCGGWLDVDANGMDGIRENPVENMRWSSNAPEGKYRFFVHNYNERGSAKGTAFKAELEVNGKVHHYHGGPLKYNAKETVFEFDYRRGQQPDFKVCVTSSTSASDDAWNVQVNDFVKVNGITTSPNLWGENPISHAGNHIFFLLEGCRDLSEGKGRGFFNEMLKSDLREIRKTLEAYTANTPIEGADKASACGVGYSKDNEWNLTLKVTTVTGTAIYKIDRWD